MHKLQSKKSIDNVKHSPTVEAHNINAMTAMTIPTLNHRYGSNIGQAYRQA